MTDLLHTDLTAEQRTRAGYIFADHIFGVDSAAFVYEVNHGGEITGRRPMTMTSARPGRRPDPRICITVLADPHPTHNAEAAFDLLAEAIMQSTSIQQEAQAQ